MSRQAQEEVLRDSLKKYFWDSAVQTVSVSSFVLRVLLKGTTQDIQAMRSFYGEKKIKELLEKEYASPRIHLPPNLIALFTLRFELPHDLSERALKTAEKNDFVCRKVYGLPRN